MRKRAERSMTTDDNKTVEMKVARVAIKSDFQTKLGLSAIFIVWVVGYCTHWLVWL